MNSSDSLNNTNSSGTTRILETISSDSFGNALCAEGYIGFACDDCDKYAEFWPDKYFNSAQYSCK